MTTPDDKEHDKLLCERLAKTVDHGICKCAERHRIAELEAECDALRAALDDERGLRAALFKYARIILFDPRNPLAYPLEHNPHAIGSKNAQADIERCLRAAIAGAAKVDKTEASK